MPKYSKQKGKAFERRVANILETAFNEKFIRVPNSGAYTGGKNQKIRNDLPDRLKNQVVGDIICPPEFPYVIECKYYKDGIKPFSLFKSNSKLLLNWLGQVKSDAKFANKHYLLIFKFNRTPIMAATAYNHFITLINENDNLAYMRIGDFVLVALDVLIDLVKRSGFYTGGNDEKDVNTN